MYQYPYGNAQQLNLDWLMEQWQIVKENIDGSLQGEIDRVEAAITDLLAARDAAVVAAGAANTSAGAAAQSAQAAAADAATATAQAAAATQERVNAAQAANNAQTYAGNAQTQAAAAQNAAGQAAASASQAAASALSASGDATNAAASAAAAQQSFSLADAARQAAQGYTQNAAASAQQAEDVANSIPEDYSELSAEVAEHSDAIEVITEALEYDGVIQLQKMLLWENGSINANYQEVSDTRQDWVRTKEYYHSDIAVVLKLKKTASTGAIIYLVYTKNNDTYTGESRTVISGNEVTITLDPTKYYRFCITASSTSSVIDTSDVSEYGLFQIYILQGIGGISNIEQAQKQLGSDKVSVTPSNPVTANTKTEITTFPKSIKQHRSLSLCCIFSAFTGLIIGQGYEELRGKWLEIDTQNIVVKDSERVIGTVAHGIDFTNIDRLNIVLDMKPDSKAKCILTTANDTFSYDFTFGNEIAGNPFFIPLQNVANVKFSIVSETLRKPLWIFGDSYFSVYANRIAGQLEEFGYFDNILIDAFPGYTSNTALTELLKCLNFGTPKYLVWCLGLNDTFSGYETVYNTLSSICTTKNITLILYRIPTVQSHFNDNQAINTFVMGTGLRYVNAYAAVMSTTAGVWLSGLLDTNDNTHPTVLGAEMLAGRMLIDVPEIMEY